MPILKLRTLDGRIYRVDSDLVKYSINLKKELEKVDIDNLQEGEIINLPYSDPKLINRCINFVKLQAKYLEPTRKYLSTDSDVSNDGFVRSNSSQAREKFYLESSDGIQFLVGREVIEESAVLKDMLEMTPDDPSSIIPLPNVHSKHMRMIIDLVKIKHNHEDEDSLDREKNIYNYMQRFGLKEAVEILQIATYLQMHLLIAAAAPTVSKFLSTNRHRPNFIRGFLKLEDDLTEEMKEELIKDQMNYF
ncbi:SKP1-like protein 5 [Cotesia glomerata]|uniref:SKP1-like protein 5 n=1 Tax=Cotesia glomerata TaxID=32391 RepID=UPI001D027B6A|nr:SKP1-like protein 5 [Cotesia glomerata]